MSPSEAFASMLGNSEKGFRDYITKARKGDAPITTLEMHACATLFECVIIINENSKWISYSPKFRIDGDGRKSTLIYNKPYNFKTF